MSRERAVRILVRGRVQGVGYRYFVWHLAERLGVVGHVRNLPDGSVEVEAAGDEERLAELRRGLRQGPPAAVVTDLEEEDLPGPVSRTGFDVVY